MAPDEAPDPEIEMLVVDLDDVEFVVEFPESGAVCKKGFEI